MDHAAPQLVLVDGSNVRRSTWPNPAPQAFVDALARWAGDHPDHVRVVVVFDGTSRAASPSDRLEVVDIPYADDELVRIAADAVESGERVTAATSDRELRARLHEVGAEVAWGGGSLLRELGLARGRR